jgi:hypothetical protein
MFLVSITYVLRICKKPNEESNNKTAQHRTTFFGRRRRKVSGNAFPLTFFHVSQP